MADHTDLQPLALDALHRRYGARMVPFAGHAMPLQYEGIIAEHRWTRTAAGLFDVSHMGQIVLTGADADQALERLVPGDIVGLRQGCLRYSMLLNSAGGIVDDLMVTRRAGELYLVVNGATKHADIAYLQAQLPADVTLTCQLDQVLLALQGPQAVTALERLAPGVASLSFMRAGAFAIDGVPAWISRSGYTGEDGFEISMRAADAARIAERLLAQPEVKPVGLGARDSLRLEAGLPLYGHDLTPETTPVEASLAFAISKRRKREGGFPGAERVLRQLFDGVARRRIGLRIDGRQPVREGMAVVHDGAAVGTVTSGGYGPALGAPIAMAYVATELAQDGQRLGVEVRGRLVEARVVPMPFFPKNYVRQGAAK